MSDARRLRDGNPSPRERRGNLFHTRTGDLDFGWAILLVCCVVGLTIFTAQACGLIPGPSIAAWSWFGAFTTMAFISGATISRARLIAASQTPGSVAGGIGISAPEHTSHSMTLLERDERVDGHEGEL